MKKLLLVLLCICLCTPSFCALSQETSGPEGLWIDADGVLTFLLQADYELSPEAAETFAMAFPGIVQGVTLPAGTLLSTQQMEQISGEGQARIPTLTLPEEAPQLIAASSTVPEDNTPSLELFALDGEWFYNENDVLSYRHTDGSRVLTVDEVFDLLNGRSTSASAGKKVYFTFDDAPSQYTMDLLATLDALNVRATFFVVGAYVKARPVFLHAIYDQGHVIGNHSYSHDQSILQESVSSCVADFKKCQNRVNEALGFDYPMTVLRVPYGSSTISYASQTALEKLGYLWIDWNALNGDAEEGIDSDEESYEYALRTANRCEGDVVLLMHDGKKRTIRMLPDLVQYFRDNGYEFAVVSTDITEKIDGVRMGFPVK